MSSISLQVIFLSGRLPEVSLCKPLLNLTVPLRTASHIIQLWALKTAERSATASTIKTALAKRELVAECARAPLLISVPLQCFQLSDCDVTVTMTVAETTKLETRDPV